MIISLCRKTFIKVFKNLAKEMNVDISNVQLGICYNGKTTYEAYNNLKKVKDIELDDYVGGIIDFSGGTEVIKSTISQACITYSKELKCRREDINIIMQYNNDKLPNAVLLCENKKVRKIDIEVEFLN